jgi:signal transduction histidine kinase
MGNLVNFGWICRQWGSAVFPWQNSNRRFHHTNEITIKIIPYICLLVFTSRHMKNACLKINSIIAHDLRDSLSSISGISDILINNWDAFSKEEKLEILEEIKETSDSTMRLLSDLLDWGKQVAEISEMEKKIFNAECVVNSMIEIYQAKSKRKNLEIANLVPSACSVFGDENMFAAIVRNLLANSIKSCTNAGKIIVNAEHTGSLIRFSVTDNGIGMTKSQIDRLFPDNENIANQSVPEAYNNGFGLILCRDFVKINGGTLWAESEEGIGTSVFFTFPEAIIS